MQSTIAQARQFEAVNSKEVETQLNKSEFIHRERCGCGVTIHTFRVPGESVEGRLRPCQSWDRADRARTAELHYLSATGEQAAIAIRLSKFLWQTINKNHLFGRWVKITYKGSVRGKFPNAMKIYLVEVDKGAITEKFERVDCGYSKNAKYRAARKIRRPNTDERRKKAS